MAKDKGHSQDSKAAGSQPPPSHEPSPVLRELHKRVRNTKKKIARCEELEGLRAGGHELNPEQAQSLAHKGGLVAVLEELGKCEPLLKEAVKEEVKQENQVACEKQERRLRTKWEAEQGQKEQAWQAERAELQHAAAQAREEKEAAERAGPSPDKMQELLRDPLRKLLQLLYFSELFDTLKNPWLSQAEAQACLGYDQLRPATKHDQHLTINDLMNIVFFGRALLARLDKPLSHQAFIDLSVDMALKWLYQPKAEAIPSPPAPHRVTVGQLASQLSRVMASDFVTVTPTPEGGSTLPESAATGAPMGNGTLPAPVAPAPAATGPAPPPMPGLAAAAMGVAGPPPARAPMDGGGRGRRGGGRGSGSAGAAAAAAPSHPSGPPPHTTADLHPQQPHTAAAPPPTPPPQQQQPVGPAPPTMGAKGAPAYVTEPPVAPTSVAGGGFGRPPPGMPNPPPSQAAQLPHSLSLGGDVVVPPGSCHGGAGGAPVGSGMPNRAGGGGSGQPQQPSTAAADKPESGAAMPAGVVRGTFTPASIMIPEGPQVVPYTAANSLGGLFPPLPPQGPSPNPPMMPPHPTPPTPATFGTSPAPSPTPPSAPTQPAMPPHSLNAPPTHAPNQVTNNHSAFNAAPSRPAHPSAPTPPQQQPQQQYQPQQQRGGAPAGAVGSPAGASFGGAAAGAGAGAAPQIKPGVPQQQQQQPQQGAGVPAVQQPGGAAVSDAGGRRSSDRGRGGRGSAPRVAYVPASTARPAPAQAPNNSASAAGGGGGAGGVAAGGAGAAHQGGVQQGGQGSVGGSGGGGGGGSRGGARRGGANRGGSRGGGGGGGGGGNGAGGAQGQPSVQPQQQPRPQSAQPPAGSRPQPMTARKPAAFGPTPLQVVSGAR